MANMTKHDNSDHCNIDVIVLIKQMSLRDSTQSLLRSFEFALKSLYAPTELKLHMEIGFFIIF